MDGQVGLPSARDKLMSLFLRCRAPSPRPKKTNCRLRQPFPGELQVTAPPDPDTPGFRCQCRPGSWRRGPKMIASCERLGVRARSGTSLPQLGSGVRYGACPRYSPDGTAAIASDVPEGSTSGIAARRDFPPGTVNALSVSGGPNPRGFDPLLVVRRHGPPGRRRL